MGVGKCFLSYSKRLSFVKSFWFFNTQSSYLSQELHGVLYTYNRDECRFILDVVTLIVYRPSSEP